MVSGPAAIAVSISPNVVCPAGPVAGKAPVTFSRAQCTAKAPRSRASTTRTSRPGSPGASTSPPRSILRTQYGKRPLGSCGPTISPERRCTDRPAKCRSTARSDPTLYGPYCSMSKVPSSLPASGPQSCTGVSGRTGCSGQLGYALTLETKT